MRGVLEQDGCGGGAEAAPGQTEQRAAYRRNPHARAQAEKGIPSTAPPPAKRARLANLVPPLESLSPATSAPRQILDFSALPPIPWSDRDDEVLLAHWEAIVDGRISWMDVWAVFPLQTHDELLRRIQQLIQNFPSPAAGQLPPSFVKPDSSTRPDLHKQPLSRPSTTSPPSDASLRSFHGAIAALRGVPINPRNGARDCDHPQAGRPLQAPRSLLRSSRSPSPASPEVSHVPSYKLDVARALRRAFGQPRPHNLFAQPVLSAPSPAMSPVVNLRPQPLYAVQAPALSLPSSFCDAPRSETDDQRIPTSADFLPVKPASIACEPALQ
ncbi:hypothetical protein NBRC10512_005449 [Rhodotorula toruloides]|uniref:Uncharacterized protein n=1 Tax=Rhodotorula toruloides (strain NP11) TaxID=1130832 RepID=M7WES6_RHOT1|nr:uncharacterized protein RHTO_05495 [Rhodotorula toruloides NP11]EMS18927.1 hypothetical protein RHTO_05495 [Rhodotorula toruloides NP11]